MRRYLFALILGLGGVAILVNLGLWQLRRLEWKEAMLSRIEAEIGGPPGVIPAAGADVAGFKYRPVAVSGQTTGEEIHVLSGMKDAGAGYEIIAAFETAEGRRILLDRGFVPEADKSAARPPVALDLTGNLHWPEEIASATPAPDMGRNIWFARDVPAMAAALRTEPILVVLRQASGDAQGVSPVPIDSSGIRNDHLNYAITWFSLAAVWAGMTVYLLWRIRQRTI